MHIIILAVVAAAVLVGSISFVLLQGPPKEEAIEKIEESIEMYLYVDADGNASGKYIDQLAPSKLTTALKFVIGALGFDAVKQSYVEEVRGYFARYGFETENFWCEVTGLGAEENLKITMSWQVLGLARRAENLWTITFGWVDNQSAAQETIARAAYSLTLIRNISKNAQYISFGRTLMVLPPGAENVVFPLTGSSGRTDYGGGSYGEVSWRVENIDGRPAIVEDSQSLITTEEITITPEQLLENYFDITVEYRGVSPENASFVNSMDQVRLDLKYGRGLSTHYLITADESEYLLSPAQILYYAADAIVTINQGDQFSIGQLIAVTSPGDENGDFGSSWKNLSKSEYISLAQAIRDSISSNGQAPGTVETSIGKIRYRDILYTFTRILSSYKDNWVLPNDLTFAPSPSGELTLNGASVPANYVYFLLPDTYVLTNTAKVNNVLSEVYEPGYDNEEYASKLCDWANGNITYTFIPTPPTSDEVLETKKGQCRDYANVYLALLRTARIPAKRMAGWIIYTGAWRPPGKWESIVIGKTPEGQTIASHAWTQVYLPDKGWVFADPTAGAFEMLPYGVYKEMPQTWTSALAAYETAYGLI